MNFRDTVVVVTGASSGIGRECAARLLAQEALVAGFDLETLPDQNARYKHYFVDVRDEAGISSAVADVEASFGPIHGLVNCAGVFSCSKPFYEITQTEWARVVETNLTGTFLCAKYASRGMCDRRKGKIVNISCIRSRIVKPNMADYAASKGGVVALTSAMAVDLAKFNIQVNSVAPGFTLTGMTENTYRDPNVRSQREELIPIGRVAQPSDVAKVVLFLLSDGSDYMTGETIFVDGGFSVAE